MEGWWTSDITLSRGWLRNVGDRIRKAASRVCRVFVTFRAFALINPRSCTRSIPVFFFSHVVTLQNTRPRISRQTMRGELCIGTASLLTCGPKPSTSVSPITHFHHDTGSLLFYCSFSFTYVALPLCSLNDTFHIVVIDRTNRHGFNTPVNLYGKYPFTLIWPSLTHIPRLK